MKKFLALCLAAVMALSLVACGGNNAADNGAGNNTANNSGDAGDSGSTGGAFKIGVIGPMTGTAAIYGTNVANSVQIAVDEINALGGDIQFELLTPADDVNDAEASVNAYNKLMDNGMQILVGTVTTQPALSVFPMTNDDRVFTITPSASGDDCIEGNDTVFQVCFTDSNQGTRSAQYIDENFPGAKIGIIYKDDEQYSIGIRNNFVAEAEERGMEIVYQGTFQEATQTDFNVQLTAAQNAGADLLFLPIYYTPAASILSQADTMGYAPTFFGVDGMDGILTADNFDPALAEGVYLLTPFSADAEDELTQNFVAAYQDKHGEIPNQFGADAYDAVYILYEAIKAAGVTADMDRAEMCDALIAAMGDLAVVGITSAGFEMTWDENGAVSKEPTAVVIQDGAYVTPQW